MCTWSMIETVGYFTRRNSVVFACTMDMSKAFDMVKHSKLFMKWREAKLPLIFLRLIMYIYKN